MARLPSDLSEKICYASELGDVRVLSDLIARVSQSDTELAEVLSRYAEEYKFEEILRLLS